jgi:hypothetical protein
VVVEDSQRIEVSRRDARESSKIRGKGGVKETGRECGLSKQGWAGWQRCGAEHVNIVSIYKWSSVMSW